jgi:peptidoglycan/LPS O-acetylase OafA/YrhL
MVKHPKLVGRGPGRDSGVSSTGMTAKSYQFSFYGLRGFAALSVVFFHLGHWLYVPTIGTNCGLAVDLFFCLSGYVVALSYGTRSQPDLSLFDFLMIRSIRLGPLIVLATLISGPYALLRLLLKHDDSAYGELAEAFVFGALTIPFFGASRSIGGPQVFPLNGPQYTLFFELFVNLVWFATRRLAQLPLALGIASVSFVSLLYFGAGGGDTSGTFLDGFPRVGYSYFIGVVIYELQRKGLPYQLTHLLRWSFVPLFATMAAIFYTPTVASTQVWFLWVIVISPLMVMSSAQIDVPARLRKPCAWAGSLSYPIYALHYPIFCWINGTFRFFDYADLRIEIPLTVVSVVGLSALANQFYDRPMRYLLTQRHAISFSRTPVARPAD